MDRPVFPDNQWLWLQFLTEPVPAHLFRHHFLAVLCYYQPNTDQEFSQPSYPSVTGKGLPIILTHPNTYPYLVSGHHYHYWVDSNGSPASGSLNSTLIPFAIFTAGIYPTAAGTHPTPSSPNQVKQPGQSFRSLCRVIKSTRQVSALVT